MIYRLKDKPKDALFVWTSTMRHLIFEDEPRTGAASSNSEDNHFRLSPRQTVDLRLLVKQTTDRKKVFCSFELFPVKNPGNIYQRFFAETSECQPLFYTLTWHKKKSSADCISLGIVREFPGNTILHLTAKGLHRQDIDIILNKVLALGIKNICVLRGDDISGTSGDFKYAADLVKYVRDSHGDRFCISVAGYPEMHPESLSREEDLFYLKQKVDAGADFIITQIVFEANTFIDFVKDCREIGIKVPIIPGIFPFPDFTCLEKMTNICKVQIPEKIIQDLTPIKNDDEAICNYGIELSKTIIESIIKSGTANGFHLFTLNRVSPAIVVCKKLADYLYPELGSSDSNEI